MSPIVLKLRKPLRLALITLASQYPHTIGLITVVLPPHSPLLLFSLTTLHPHPPHHSNSVTLSFFSKIELLFSSRQHLICFYHAYIIFELHLFLMKLTHSLRYWGTIGLLCGLVHSHSIHHFKRVTPHHLPHRIFMKKFSASSHLYHALSLAPRVFIAMLT